jgi:acetyl-CoA carboxylase carboxyl transferase subunit alpha
MEQGLVDQIIKEPLGGAHRDPDAVAKSLKAVLVERLDALSGMTPEALIAARYKRLMAYGRFKES